MLKDTPIDDTCGGKRYWFTVTNINKDECWADIVCSCCGDSFKGQRIENLYLMKEVE